MSPDWGGGVRWAASNASIERSGDTGESALVASLSSPFPFTSLRWGTGAPAWPADHLYVSDREQVFEIDVGIPGPPHPAVATQ